MSTNLQHVPRHLPAPVAKVATTLPAVVASNLPATPEDATRMALAVRTPAEALDHPTLGHMLKAYGRDGILDAITALVSKAMDALAEQRRLSPMGVAIFAEELLERYPHEALADLGAFLRGVIVGSWGEPGKEGKTFGQLDVPTLMSWWRQYMATKVAAVEARHEREAQKRGTTFAEPSEEAAAKLAELRREIGEAALGAKELEQRDREARQLRTLVAQMPKMDDHQLREAWGLYRFAEAREAILAEAAARGLEIRKP